MEENENTDKKEEQLANNECEILPSDYSQFDFNFKIIIIGNSGVGKTCLTVRASSGEYQDKMGPTLGIEYFPFVVKYKEKILKLEMWDTCGQEAYRSIVKTFFF
jgi:small GTP-binding protein